MNRKTNEELLALVAKATAGDKKALDLDPVQLSIIQKC